MNDPPRPHRFEAWQPPSARVSGSVPSRFCTYYRFVTMDSWGRPNPNDHRHVSETNSLPSPTTPTTQRQPSLRHQDQSESQLPFVSNPGSPLHHTIPIPVTSSEPPLWQLGRHSTYKSATSHSQRSPGFPEEGDFGKWDFERVQHQVNKFDESKLVDVEGDLQRGLKARQVRLHASFLRERDGS